MECKLQDQTGKRHYDQIDALRGIAIFLVVLGHSIIYYPVDLHENVICNFIFRWLSSVHMPIFFIVSGFCFSFYGSYKSYIWKKVKKLMVPYLVFNAMDVVPRCLLPNLVNRSRGIGESLKNIVLNGGEYWFLYTLFIIFLIYPAIYKVIRNNAYRSGAALIVILVLRYCIPTISTFTLSQVVNYLFYFMLGATIKQFWGNRVFEKDYNKFKVIALIVILFAVWIILISVEASYLGVATALIGILTFYLCVQFRVIIRAFKCFGKYSLQLYLFNGYLLVISRTIIVSVLGITNPFVIIAFNMLVDFFLSYIIIKYVCERIKIAKIFMGMQ